MDQPDFPKTYRLKKNLGPKEAVIRVAAGLVILGLGAAYGSWWGLVGLLPLITGVLRYCPAYSLIGGNPFGKND